MQSIYHFKHLFLQSPGAAATNSAFSKLAHYVMMDFGIRRYRNNILRNRHVTAAKGRAAVTSSISALSNKNHTSSVQKKKKNVNNYPNYSKITVSLFLTCWFYTILALIGIVALHLVTLLKYFLAI